MKIHPRILEISKVIERLKPSNLLSIETLERLNKFGATATEAAITLHLIFSIPLEEAGDFVINSSIFPVEDVNDSAYATFTYMYYDETGDL